MAWRPHGRAVVNSRRPENFKVCDRCGFWYNGSKLSWQYQWAGPQLQNIRLLVCEICKDKPQEQLRTFAIPADPVPVQNPRVEQFETDNTTFFVTESGDPFTAEDGVFLVTENSVPPPSS